MGITYPPEMLPKADEDEEAEVIVQCPACEGTGFMKDVKGGRPYFHTCRCCDGLGRFPEPEMLNRVKDHKTWPDSIRNEMLGDARKRQVD